MLTLDLSLSGNERAFVTILVAVVEKLNSPYALLTEADYTLLCNACKPVDKICPAFIMGTPYKVPDAYINAVSGDIVSEEIEFTGVLSSDNIAVNAIETQILHSVVTADGPGLPTTIDLANTIVESDKFLQEQRSCEGLSDYWLRLEIRIRNS